MSNRTISVARRIFAWLYFPMTCHGDGNCPLGTRMTVNQLTAAGRRISPGLFGMFVFVTGCLAPSAGFAANEIAPTARATVSAEALAEELAHGEQVAIINADDASSSGDLADVKRVYYSTALSTRAAQDAAQRDRRAGAQARWLLGNTEQWKSSRLPRMQGVDRTEPLRVKPVELALALADAVDMQVVDLRSRERFDVATIATAESLLPHEFEAELERFSKRRWLVLIDQGDGIADALARTAFAKGHRLVAVIDGGFPAWAAAENR